MACCIYICHLLVFMYIFGVSEGNIYSKQANLNTQDDTDLNFEDQEKPFRMQKVNLLWTKGKKGLSGVKLADLYADLKVHDKYEAQLKKMRADDLDRDGAMEAKVLENYKRIVDYYGLDDLFGGGGYMDNEIPLDDSERKIVQFKDSKLQNMWKKAEEAGFSEEDLKTLKEEFWHQQMKIDEYEFVHRELDKIPDPNDNSVNIADRKTKESLEEALQRKITMKKDKRNVKEGYMKLEHLVASLPASKPTFKDSRVHKLWALALKTNWTEEELNGFKEELLHFEHRLNKQAYYKQQFDLSAHALEHLKDGDEVPEKHLHLEEKNKLLGQKIKKIHSEFKTRLDKALMHSEL